MCSWGQTLAYALVLSLSLSRTPRNLNTEWCTQDFLRNSGDCIHWFTLHWNRHVRFAASQRRWPHSQLFIFCVALTVTNSNETQLGLWTTLQLWNKTETRQQDWSGMKEWQSAANSPSPSPEFQDTGLASQTRAPWIDRSVLNWHVIVMFQTAIHSSFAFV